ncbi:MAG TPA: elongation factor G, partial [Alphaproteobacteria bacterium]|nr:elongation factor G [Pelagibacteraceae bacterium]HJL58078.1 elongation factor G [Alphaproteobacteria bacterium]
MMKKPINSSRCITIVGPSQSGKTSLLESILHICKQIPNKGQVSDDNTLSDHLPEEHNLKMSISMGISKAQFMDEDFTFIDCPGSSEFINEFLQAIRISDLSVVVIEPIKEKILSLVPYFFYLNKMNVPHILFINKVDNLNFDIKELLGTIQEYSSNPLVIRQIPIREGDKIIGAADVIHERAYTYTKDKPSQIVKIPDQLSSTRDEIREKVLETLADFDDALMEKILEDVPTSTEEIYEHLKKDIASNNIVEVLTGSAENETGIRRLLKTIRHDCPDHEKTVERNGLKINKDSACVQVFKTNFIPHRGKQSIVRVWSGELQEGATLQDSIRLQNLFSLKGKEFVKIAKAKGGDVIGLSRIESIKTGDLISDGNKKIDKDGDIPIPPQPIYSKAIRTIKREDDVKLSESLKEIIETDSSYSIERNAVTQQLLIWGQGEIHLRIALNKLKNNYNIETKVEKINFAFSETIQGSVSDHITTHKKQSGGAGQYARVVVDVKPLPRG